MTGMKPMKRFYCRAYQTVFDLGSRVLPWRKPEIVSGAGSTARIPELLRGCGVKKVMIVSGKHTGAALVPSIRAQIEAAEAAVEAQNDKQRDKLPNLTVLEEAQTEYETVLEEQAETEACVQEAENAIDAIGSVTLDSGETALLIMDVTPGGPGDEAGLREGDLLLKADGEALTKSADLLRIRRRHDAGDSLALTYERNGKRSTVNVILRESTS